ncbi:hypothetical protein B2J86_17315 [Acidovorax sp. SRB_14]|uniref:hypothetical protein n=1 Tax=Acidovorax sp. SRB_14 TaxID=1962699 RepID=UPI001564BE10|nr:hypothetical protein [Acidovorax sp. SRB_14]NMM82661.1 hypothetical protein [Acidovorax sp. SRB_14]
MKKILAFVIFGLMHASSFALGEIHSFSENEQKAIQQFAAALSLGEEDAVTVYKSVLQPHMKSGTWVYKFFDNETLDKSQLSESTHKFAYVALVNEDRFVNYSFLKVQGTSQVLVYVVESLPRTSQVASKRDKELRADKKFDTVGDQKNFSMFKEKGKANLVSVYASGGLGGIQYADHYLIDLKGR